jgi:uncharacterized protein (TIGR00369 family)
MTDTEPKDHAEGLNARRDGWSTAMGLRYVKATEEEVVGELTVGPANLQPFGIVHGGVHCGIVEALGSIGAAISASGRKQSVVGLDNHTAFVRAVRAGTVIRGVAKPLTRGRTSQLWEVVISDPEGKLVATGRLRVLCLEQDAALAGEPIRKPIV